MVRSFFRSPRSSRSLLAAFALSVAVPPASAQQILEIHAQSIATYKPTSATAVGGLRPLALQRGTNLDGTLRAPPAFSMALQANPFESAWRSHERLGELDLANGTWSPLEIDIALPCKGRARWVAGRTYNARQKNSGGSYFDSNSYLGKNWALSSQPEIVFYDDATNADDMVYLVAGADRYIPFQRHSSTSNQFKSKNGAAGVFDYQAGTPDLWVYHDQVGTKFTFLGFNTTNHAHDSLLWKIEDEDQNVSFVGDATSVSTAISTGWDSAGRILYAFDSADRRYSHAYSNIDSVVRLTQVKAETKTGGTWSGTPTGISEVAKVDYAYYGDETYGDVGALKKVTITTPLTDSGVSSVHKTYYRYWEGTFNASTNPGHPYALKYVYEAEGLRQYDYAGDANFDEDFLTASNTTLDPYAAAYFEYDSEHRITKSWFHGDCGCSGGANGTHEFTYETVSYTSTSGYDAATAMRTTVKLPDGTYVTQEFDEAGQAMDRVVSDIYPGTQDAKYWITAVERDGTTATINAVHTPENITGYTHSSAAKTKDGNIGKIDPPARETSGNLKGFLLDRRYKKGTSGTAYLDETVTYTSLSKTIGDTSVVRPLVASAREYTLNDSTTTTGSNLASYSYTSYSGKLAVETVTITNPIVSTGNNGSGSATTRSTHYRVDGLVDFEKDEAAIITYHAYTNGQETTEIEDADTTSLSPPTNFSSSGTPLHHKRVHDYDAQGRRKKTTSSYGTSSAYAIEPSYYSRLADQRLVTLSYPEYEASPEKFYGPAQYAVTNLAGGRDVQGVIAVTGGSSTAAQTTHIDENDADPITAVDTGSSFGSLAQMAVSVYDEAGAHLEEERRYFVIPSSGAGTDSANYDPTKYGYDSRGRRWRVKEASGTIRRTVYDKAGRVIESWLGTNDNSFSGGESSGTDNMVKTEIREYDGGFDKKNSHLTKLTQRVQDTSTGERVTNYSYDYRGRRLLEERPTAPHAFHKVDNLGRTVATGLFSSIASIVVASDDPTTETANRLALTQTFFDEMGRTWKSQRHKIDAADGSDDDNLQTLSWYDAAGRLVKQDGEVLTKTAYDRLGRGLDAFVLGKDNDTVYGDADDVTGDIVFEQHETRYDTAKGTVILEVRFDRLHTDISTGETTGALDTNADNDLLLLTDTNVKGRAHISALWYDTLERLEDRVEYGTNSATGSIATFDRDPLSVPARSDTALRTTYEYDTDGALLKVTDPKAYVTKYEYDDLGRRTKEIRHYDANVASGAPSGTDDNVTERYEYTDGQRTKLIADLPTGSTDQETLYIYGTTKGTPSASKIATGHLLRATKYPDSTNTGTTSANVDSDSSDVESHAYNAQGQGQYKKDQAGNIFETDFDLAGRGTQRRVTTLASGFDGAVRRIATTYDSLGRTQLVTQYDNATVGSGSVVDEVKNTYDGWGNLTNFEQDRNSAVGASGSVDDYEISYTWVKATTGRNTLRRDTMTLPSGRTLTYKYRSRDGLHDDVASRVTDVLDGATALMVYDYNGVGQVVGTDYPQPDVMWKQYTTSGTYPDLDRFDRVVKSRWTKDLATDRDFYKVELAYDRNSNITSADDQVHAGFDVAYAMDDVDRLVDADEGTLSGGSISSRTRRQQFTLSHTGNWDEDKLDLNGDGDWGDTDEVDDCRTHNVVNELTARNTNCTGGNEFTLTYDAVGAMTDDGEDYEYKWDAFGRLREVRRTDNQALVAEYRYNGLGYRIAVHEDTDTDNDVDSNDKWYYDAFDERWRQVARFRESDSSPKEDFVHHAAGNSGYGGSSYIDLVVCRNKDANTAWTSASDGTLEERVYYCQNQHADVSAIVSAAGAMLEWAKYSAYGVPFGLPGGDTNSDGDCDSGDATQIQAWIDAPSYDVRGDLDLDSDVDTADKSAALAAPYLNLTGGYAVLSPLASSRRALAAAEQIKSTRLRSTRSRVANTLLGLWIQCDDTGRAVLANPYGLFRHNPTLSASPNNPSPLSTFGSRTERPLQQHSHSCDGAIAPQGLQARELTSECLSRTSSLARAASCDDSSSGSSTFSGGDTHPPTIVPTQTTPEECIRRVFWIGNPAPWSPDGTCAEASGMSLWWDVDSVVVCCNQTCKFYKVSWYCAVVSAGCKRPCEPYAQCNGISMDETGSGSPEDVEKHTNCKF